MSRTYSLKTIAVSNEIQGRDRLHIEQRMNSDTDAVYFVDLTEFTTEKFAYEDAFLTVDRSGETHWRIQPGKDSVHIGKFRYAPDGGHSLYTVVFYFDTHFIDAHPDLCLQNPLSFPPSSGCGEEFIEAEAAFVKLILNKHRTVFNHEHMAKYRQQEN